ncbi:MAG TPA: S8 family serine peptidase [Steroidobacteraceae bacterium]|nr:S8 family serine peptidase [Steroidobacteraceae bacterium]
MKARARLRRLGALLWPLLATAALGATSAPGDPPWICRGEVWNPAAGKLPTEVSGYIDDVGAGVFDSRAACAQWAGFNTRKRDTLSTSDPPPARLIIYPSASTDVRRLSAFLADSGIVRSIERRRTYLIASFDKRVTGAHVRSLLASEHIEYAEPDCDGPDFLTTSNDLLTTDLVRDCWLRGARQSFPNDPCIDELWGHASIGWNPSVAAKSLPRIVAILDSGVDASHEDLKRNIVAHTFLRTHTESSRLNARCATSGRCYSHGTEMAGTIGGRMDNGIGVAGVAPNSLLLPIVISSVDTRMLARLSTIAQGIDEAARSGVDIINISAKWPVDSRAISEAILEAVGGDAARRRLVVTGYTTTLRADDSVREYYPSRYRCLPGVLAAVPTDMRGRNLSHPKGHPNANDGRIQAPGVDIVVTTTENSDGGYTLSEAAGASSAAAYVSGTVALVWGSPPLNKCDAQQIKELLFCRSKSSDSTRYPWINVDFLRELASVDPESDCGSAMAALGCS